MVTNLLYSLKIWLTSVVIASLFYLIILNYASTEQPPANLKDLPQRLAKVFPYQHYEILGQHLQDVFREYESWVVPSKDLFLKVDSKGPAAGGGVNLHLQFWRDQQVLVKTDAVLRSGSPLFIGGPKWRDGQLVFVLILQ